MTTSRRRVPALLLLTGSVLLAAGCGGNPPESVTPDATDQNLMHLVQLYTAYTSKHSKQKATSKKDAPSPVPASSEELKTWAKALPADELQKMGITGDVEGMFVSPRDQQPYQLAKPSNPMAAKMGAMKVIFYEKEGVNGKHMVVGGMGTRPREVTREELRQDVPDFGG